MQIPEARAAGRLEMERQPQILRVERKILQGAHYPRDLGSPRTEATCAQSLELGKGETGRRGKEDSREGGKEVRR